MAEIAINRKEGYLRISNPPNKLDINYNNPNSLQVVGKIQIDNSPAKLEIDQTKCLEEVGYRKFNSQLKYLRGEAEKKTGQAIAEIVHEGEFLAKVEKGSNQIAKLAKRKMNSSQKEFGVKAIPSSPPEINVQTYPIKVKVNQSKIQVEDSFVYPQVDFKSEKLDIYLAQKGELKINVIGDFLNYRA